MKIDSTSDQLKVANARIRELELEKLQLLEHIQKLTDSGNQMYFSLKELIEIVGAK